MHDGQENNRQAVLSYCYAKVTENGVVKVTLVTTLGEPTYPLGEREITNPHRTAKKGRREERVPFSPFKIDPGEEAASRMGRGQ